MVAATGKIPTFIGDGASSRKEMNFALRLWNCRCTTSIILPLAGRGNYTSRDSSSTTLTEKGQRIADANHPTVIS